VSTPCPQFDSKEMTMTPTEWLILTITTFVVVIATEWLILTITTFVVVIAAGVWLLPTNSLKLLDFSTGNGT